MRATPLAPAYAAGARGTLDLLGWRYPAEFAGAADEHRHVRAAAGLFDFSFMAHALVRGPDALAFVQAMVTNDAGRLAPGAMLYSPIVSEVGTLVDDCTVLRRAGDDYLVTSGLERTIRWLERHRGGFEVSLEDASPTLAVLAVQGPRAADVLADLGLGICRGLGHLRSAECAFGGAPAVVARLGYTGELGYELFVPADDAVDLWRRLLAAGAPAGLRPCGGRALDSLRIEAGYLLTQVDFDDATTPFEAGLGRFVKLDKGEFVGRAALAAMGEPARRLNGLRAAAGLAARGAPVTDATGRVVGRVTSSCLSPTLGGQLAYAYLEREGTTGGLCIAGVPGTVARAELPFYDSAGRRAAVAQSVRDR